MRARQTVRALARAGAVLMLVVSTWATAVGFTPSAPMATPRAYHPATSLADGRLLVVGGSNSGGVLASAEIYDPVLDTWSPAGTLATARQDHEATLLANGTVLVTGGAGAGGSPRFASAELYDPTTNAWTSAGTMAIPRVYHQSTLLANGKVLVTGGDGAVASNELYDPATNAWSPAPSTQPRYAHSATRLKTGKVLVVGGFREPTNYLGDTELFDPDAGTWTPGPALPLMLLENQDAVLLPDGRVMLVGGFAFLLRPGVCPRSQLYDAIANAWTVAAASATCLSGPVVLPSGQVLAFGVSGAELYDPPSDTWSPAGTLTQARRVAASALAHGEVVVTGGVDASGTFLASVEVYDGSAYVHARLRPSVDYDNDAVDDLTWYDPATGATQLWSMRSDPPAVATVLTDTHWRVAFKGLFDSDRFTDIVWHNATTGEWVLWLMHGTSFFAGRSLLVDPQWSITHVGDFNGDGKADLVWRNS